MHRLRLQVTGAVQGVGFRPHVYRLAKELKVSGWVLNDSGGVIVEVEGDRSRLERFAQLLVDKPPPRARVTSTRLEWLEPVGFEGFEIRHSDGAQLKSVLVMPDLATCETCDAEIFDPADRRHRYPFTNCTDCGPRFSIIESLPYDRPTTTMARFQMCPSCQAEYDDPMSRRFHAQPNACPDCGPQLTMLAPDGAVLAIGPGAIDAAAQVLLRGEVLAAQGLGGFHLMVDAHSDCAVRTLRNRKGRPAKPLGVMVGDIDAARALVTLEPPAARALTAPEAPMLLLPRVGDALSSEISPDNDNIGIVLAMTPMHRLLMSEFAGPVVATSGNLSDEPICTDGDEALRRLAGIADAFLVHDRPIVRPIDDSVAWLLRDELRVLRRARGFAPLPIAAPAALPCVLAVGGQLKNTVSVTVQEKVFVSQHIGDLDTLEAQQAFERAATDLTRLYEARPVAIAHDLHPDYVSTKWAESASRGTNRIGDAALAGAMRGLSCVPVQHHHAHLIACMADNGVDETSLGITWDGTGYGPDGTIWGGEALLGDARNYQRVAHLRPFRLPGGDVATRQPRRSALALLWEMKGEGALMDAEPWLETHFAGSELSALKQMLETGLNSPQTSSAGRLFDGVAALLGFSGRVSYEGQAAVQLETAADKTVADAYVVPLNRAQHGPAVLDWAPLVHAVLEDLHGGVARQTIAARFHNALAGAVVSVAELAGCERVALTGGCFQNRLLTERAAASLESAGFKVLLHRQVPPNDGCISLGQALVAAAQLSLSQI